MANRPRSSDHPKSRLRQNVESLALAILVALLIRSSVVEAFWVPSGSMLPTIQIGDHLFVNKLAYGLHVDVPFTTRTYVLKRWRPLQRGDIVVFVSPVDRNVDLIKRIVAVAGDTVEVRDKVLYINGQAQDEPYVVFKGDQAGRKRGLPGDSFGPRVVPAGTIFCMGDNRDNSLDSRFWGPVPLTYVKGRAVLIYWSYEAKRDDWEWRGVLYRMKQLAEVFVNFFTKTRWSRSFQLIH